MNIEFIITSGTVELLSNTNTGNNKLIVNGSEIPSTDWTGSGYYTTDGISIKKISDTSGNIFCNKITDTEYELVKAVSNPVQASSVIFDNTNTDLSASDVQSAIEELDAPTFTEASSRTNVASGDSVSTLWGKVKKFFSDLKTVAFSGKYEDLATRPLALASTSSVYLNDLDAITDYTTGRVFINAYDAASNKPSNTSGFVMTWKSSDTYAVQFAICNLSQKTYVRYKYENGWTSWYETPSAYTSNPAMDGTASAGSSANFARGDHVHPTDTSRASASTVSSLSSTVSTLNTNLSAYIQYEAYNGTINANANNVSDLTKTVTKSGYTTLGICAVELRSAGKCSLVHAFISGSDAKIRVYNPTSSAKEFTCYFRVLYRKQL